MPTMKYEMLSLRYNPTLVTAPADFECPSSLLHGASCPQNYRNVEHPGGKAVGTTTVPQPSLQCKVVTWTSVQMRSSFPYKEPIPFWDSSGRKFTNIQC